MDLRNACRLVAGAFSLFATGPVLAGAAYLEVAAGANFRGNSATDTSPPAFVQELRYETGLAANANLGYRFSLSELERLRFRPELGLAYRRNDIDKGRGVAVPTGTGGGTFNATGKVRVIQGFANLWLDVDLPGIGLTPYAGGGAGPARVWLSDFRPQRSGVDIADDADTVFGYQVGGGASYPISDALALTANYRYTSLNDANIGQAGGGTFTVELDSHRVTLGLRYRF